MTFVDKEGEEKNIKVPVGTSMLEAAHENDIELEGKDCCLLVRNRINLLLFPLDTSDMLPTCNLVFFHGIMGLV